jgi:hypothetical protein
MVESQRMKVGFCYELSGFQGCEAGPFAYYYPEDLYVDINFPILNSEAEANCTRLSGDFQTIRTTVLSVKLPHQHGDSIPLATRTVFTDSITVVFACILRARI